MDGIRPITSTLGPGRFELLPATHQSSGFKTRFFKAELQTHG